MKKLLTESLEDYLEAIAELSAAEGHAHTKEIADKLKVKMPSVTGAMRQLAQMGYIVYNTHYPVTLTEKGKLIAEQVAARHKVLKKFFIDILGMFPEAATEAACHLEHLIDEDTANRFVLFSEAIENRIDARNLRVFLSEALEMGGTFRTLNTLKSGESAVIRRIGRNVTSPEKLKLKCGSTVTLQSIPLDKSHFHLSVDGNPLEIDLETAENIFI
jgi:DtxR family Mn-dependent transcriptional regulator